MEQDQHVSMDAMTISGGWLSRLRGVLGAAPLSLVRVAVGGYWLALAIATHLPQLRIEHDRPLLLRPDLFVHFGAFALLTLGVAMARPLATRRASAMLAVALVAIYAMVDEYAQAWVGRVVALDDVLTSLSGVLAAALAMTYSSTPTVTSRQSPRQASPSGGRDASGAGGTSGSGGTSGGGGGFVRHAIVVSVFTFISRLTGLVRDAVVVRALGLTSVADAFWLGFLVPNLFRRLFGEGALTAAFIPHYTDLRKQDPLLARRFASLWIAVLTVLLSGLTVLGELGLLAASQLQWTEHASLAIRYTMIMLPYMPTICLVALIGAMLQVHGKFGPSAAAPVLLNVVMIVACVGGGLLASDVDSAEDTMRRIAMIVSVSVLVAGLVQLAWQLAALWRTDRLTLVFHGTGPAFRATLVMMLPMLIGLAVFQINSFLDSLIAFLLAAREGGPESLNLFGYRIAYPMNTGAVAALQSSQRLYQFPLGVFGIAVATAIFPALAHAAADVSEAGQQLYRRTLQQGLKLTMFIGLPASVGLILVRTPLSRVIFEGGEFTLDDATRVGTILAGYASSIWAYSMTHVLTRAFYARKDARTPLRISMAMVAFNFVLNMTLIWKLGAAGLAWATAISAVGQVVLLIMYVQRYVERPVDAAVWRSWSRTAAMTAVMGLAIAPAVWFYTPVTLSRTGAALQLATMVIVGGAVFAGGMWLIGAEELRYMRRRH